MTSRPPFLKLWWEALRVRTLPAAIAPVLVGTALAWHHGTFVPAAAALCLAFALLVQIGTNFANDYFDFKRGADGPDRVGPRRLVALGMIAPSTMRNAMIGVFIAAFLSGLGLIHWGGPWLVVVGVASILSGIAYTGGPWPIGYHGLGDLFVFIFFGLVAVIVTYAVQAGRLAADAWILAVPIGLLTTNILVVNNYRDVETDRRSGKHTSVVRFGRGFARGQFIGSHLVALLVPVGFALRGEGLSILLPLLLVPVAWRHCQRLNPAATALELIALLVSTARYLAVYAFLTAGGLVLTS